MFSSSKHALTMNTNKMGMVVRLLSQSGKLGPPRFTLSAFPQTGDCSVLLDHALQNFTLRSFVRSWLRWARRFPLSGLLGLPLYDALR
jgi:hypothetical protein